MVRRVSTGILAALLCQAAPAHADDYKKFYETVGYAGLVPLAADASPPEILRSSTDLNSDLARMWARGYQIIGMSNFSGSYENPKGAIKVAKKVGAQYVVLYTPKVGSRTGTTTSYWPRTETSPIGGRVVGGDGLQIGRFLGTATTQWTETSTQPYTINIYGHSALYFARLEPKGSGLLLDPMAAANARPSVSDAAAAARADIARGIKVLAVREGSPAATAGILPGDVIAEMNGLAVPNSIFMDLIVADAGEAPILVALYRRGTLRHIAMPIPSEWRLPPRPRKAASPDRGDRPRR